MEVKDTILKELDKQQKNSYSPYSGCRVASVLEFEDGKIVGGCNVENASYPLSLCAERNAITTAISLGLNMGELKAIYVKCNKLSHFTPCGACLQVLSEFANANLDVVILNVNNDKIEYKFSDLMPVIFDKSKLN